MKTLLVCAGIVSRADEVLIAQRKEGGHEAGYWEFPGGKVEVGEDPRAALARELHEELGIDVEVGEVYDVSSHVYGERHVVLIAFACRIRRGEPRPLDCAAVEWVRRGRLGQYSFAPADEDFVAKLQVEAPGCLRAAFAEDI